MRLQILRFKNHSFSISLLIIHKIYHKLPCYTSFHRREEYIQELIIITHPHHSQKVFQIPLEIFLVLKDWLTKYTSLKKSCKDFLVQQKLAMFKSIIRKKTSNHTIQEKFERFGDIVSYVFHEVFTLLLYLHIKIVNLSTKDDVLHPQIIDNTKYFPYFWGVLNGKHIPVHIPAIDCTAYQNRKRILS